MVRRNLSQIVRSTIIAMMVLFVASGSAAAHCDGMDGPVVTSARQALERLPDGQLVIVLVALGSLARRVIEKQDLVPAVPQAVYHIARVADKTIAPLARHVSEPCDPH